MKRAAVLILEVFASLLILVGCGTEPLSREASPNSFSGHVYQSDGKTPISGVSIKVWIRLQAKEMAVTNSDGWYIVTGLPAGEYMVMAEAPGYRPEAYGGMDFMSTKPEERIRVKVTNNSATTDIDFRLKKLASISGRVYSAGDGKPIAGARIAVYGPHWSTGPLGATTAADGSYTVTGLNAGESVVAAETEGYVPRFYKDVYLYDEAIKVTTSYGADTPNIDFALEWGGSICGHVCLPDGVTPDVETTIFYKQISGVETPILGGCVPTPPHRYIGAADASFTISGLLTGEYELLAVAQHEPYLCSGVSLVSVTTGKETKGIDLVLAPRGSICGHVYRHDGAPVAGVKVEACGWMGCSSASTHNDGSYCIEQLPPGNYMVRALVLPRDYATVSVSSGKSTAYDIIISK